MDRFCDEARVLSVQSKQGNEIFGKVSNTIQNDLLDYCEKPKV